MRAAGFAKNHSKFVRLPVEAGKVMRKQYSTHDGTTTGKPCNHTAIQQYI